MPAAPFHQLPDLHVGPSIGEISPVEEALSWHASGPERGVHHDEPLEAPRFREWECQAEDTAPVLDYERDV